jgi:hypothetical protein
MTTMTRLHSLAALGLIVAVSACEPQAAAPIDGVLAPPENPIVSVLPVNLCGFRQVPNGKVLDITVANTGTVDYGGGGSISLAIGSDIKPAVLPPIPANGNKPVVLDYPNIPGGDWSVTLQLTNQPPVTQSCLG